MTEKGKNHVQVVGDAESRVAEIDGLFRSIRGTVSHLWQEAEQGDPTATKQAFSKLTELQSTHERLLRAEEMFREKNADYLRPGEIDLGAMRDQIGRRLDQLRAAKGAAGVPDLSDG